MDWTYIYRRHATCFPRPMFVRAVWRKTVVGGFLVGCAVVTLQCGGSPAPFSGSDAGTSNSAAGSALPLAGGAGRAGTSGSAHSGEGGADSGAEGGRSNGSTSAGSGGDIAGESGMVTGGAAGTNVNGGSSGATVGGEAGRAGSAGASSAGTAGSEATAGAAGSGGSVSAAGFGGSGVAGSAGNAGGPAGGAPSGGAGGSSGSFGTAGSGGMSGSAGSATAGSGGISGGASGSAGVAGSGGGGGSCGTNATFHPRTPVVFFLLDRSSSMFAPTDYWSPVRASILATISAYTSQIRFGLAAYTGVSPQTCPLELTSAGNIALDNSASITQLLSALGAPGVKAESPTAAALASIRPTVVAQTGATSKTIFLITDGGHDFCNDTNAMCPADAVVAQLQSTFTAGVQTSIFGIKGSPYLDLTQTQAQANAGVGAPVLGDSSATYYACSLDPDWHSLWVAKGSPATQPLGTYVATSSTAVPYTLLDTAQPDTMTSALKAATAALKACTYDLSGAQVNLALASQGSVRIDGVSVPMDANNGWHMNSSTELELVGSACANWRTASTQTISFEFQCAILNP